MSIITVSDLKTYLNIPDSIDDPLLTSATAAANQYTADYCGRDFGHTATGSATARVFSAKTGCFAWVDDFWETSVLSVKVDRDDNGTYEETWVLNTDYTLEPLNGQVNGEARPYYKVVPVRGQTLPTWNVRPPLQVTAAWGWASVPDAVKYATLLQAGKLFHRKDSPQGVIGGHGDFLIIRVSLLIDPDVAFLLAPYRHPGGPGTPQVA